MPKYRNYAHGNRAGNDVRIAGSRAGAVVVPRPSKAVLRAGSAAPPVATEAQTQKAIIDFIGWACPTCYAFAVPNAAKRTKGGRAGNAVPGLRKGVYDVCIVAPGQRVYFIEVKRHGKGVKVSQDQKDFAEAMRARDVPTVVAYDLEDAMYFLQEFHLVLNRNSR